MISNAAVLLWSGKNAVVGDGTEMGPGTAREGGRPCFQFRSTDILAKNTDLWRWREPLEGDFSKSTSTGVSLHTVLI